MNDMSETPVDAGSESSDSSLAGGEQLLQFIERLERLDAEKTEIADQMKEVRAEAKGAGFDVPTINRILALRKKDPDDASEEEALYEMYRAAVGM